MNKSNGNIVFKYNLENLDKARDLSVLAFEVLLHLSDGETHYFKEDAQELGVTTSAHQQAFIELEKAGIIEVETVTYDKEHSKKNRVEG